MKLLTLLLLFPLFGWGQITEIGIPGTGMTVSADTFFLNPFVVPGKVIKFCDVMVYGKCYSKTDTIPVTIEVQYLKRDLPGLRDCYLINGEPWYKSTAPLTRGKWIRVKCYRWRISENWIKQ